MSQRFLRKRPWGRVVFDLDDPAFLHTADESLQQWLLYRLLSETVFDLEAMDRMKEDFVRGSDRPLIGSGSWSSASAEYGSDELIIAGQQVMQDWERPLMEAMVDIAAASHGDVLEVGFGMGISAELFQRRGVSSHTIIELNDEVLEKAGKWRAGRPGADIRLVRGRWQDVADDLGPFDAVFYDTYPVTDPELVSLTRVPYPRDFFPVAAHLLRPGGVFTYYTNETDSLSRMHQRALFEHFDRFTVGVVRDLCPPEDCHYWWAPSMATVGAFL